MKLGKRLRAAFGVFASTALVAGAATVVGALTPASTATTDGPYKDGTFVSSNNSSDAVTDVSKAVQLTRVGDETADGKQQWKVVWQSGSTETNHADNEFRGYGVTPYMSIILSKNLKFVGNITYSSRATYQYVTSCGGFGVGTASWKGVSSSVAIPYGESRDAYVSPTNSASDAIWSGCGLFGTTPTDAYSGSGFKLRTGSAVGSDDARAHDFGYFTNVSSDVFKGSMLSNGGQYVSFQGGATGASVLSPGRATTYTATFTTQRDLSVAVEDSNGDPNNWVAAQFKDYYDSEPYRNYIAYSTFDQVDPNPAANDSSNTLDSSIDGNNTSVPAAPAGTTSNFPAESVIDYKLTLIGGKDSTNPVPIKDAASKLKITNTAAAEGLVWLQKNADGTFSQVNSPVWVAESSDSNVYHTYVTRTSPGTVNFQVTYNNGSGTPVPIIAQNTPSGYFKEISGTWTESAPATETKNYQITRWQNQFVSGTTLPENTVIAPLSSGSLSFAANIKKSDGTSPSTSDTFWVTYPGAKNAAGAVKVTLADGTEQWRVPVHVSEYNGNTATPYLTLPEVKTPLWSSLSESTEDATTNTRSFDIKVFEKQTDTLPISGGVTTIKVSKPKTPAEVIPAVNGTSKSTVTVKDDNSPANGTSTNSITVKLVDADGNPINDYKDKITVTDTTTGVSIENVTVDDPDDQGNYVVTFTSDDAGAHSLKVTTTSPSGTKVDIGTVTSTFTEVKPAVDGATKSVTEVVTGTAPADGTSQTELKVTLKDADGQPITGLTKTDFTVTDSKDSAATYEVTETTTSGVYSVKVASKVVGTDHNVKVTADGVTIPKSDGTNPTVEFTNAPVDPAQSTVSVNCGTAGVLADGTKTCTVTVTLKDKNGNILTDDRTSQLGLTLPDAQNGQPVAAGTWTRNTDGTYSIKVKSTKSGDFAQQVTVNGDAITGTGFDGKLKFIAGALAKSVFPDNTPKTATAGVQVPAGLTFVAKDANDNPLASGSKVWVDVPGSDTRTEYTVGDKGVVTLNAFTPGIASDNQIAVYAAQTGGEAAKDPWTMTIAAGTPTDVKSGQTTIAVDPNGAKADGTSQDVVKITLRDKYGNPVTGKTITAGTLPDGVTAGTAAGGEDGVYTLPYTSTKAVANGIIDYTVDGTAIGSASLTFIQESISADKSFYFVNCGTSGEAVVGNPCSVSIYLTNDNGEILKDDHTSAIVLDTFEGGQPTIRASRDGKSITFDSSAGEYKVYYTSTTPGTFPIRPKVKADPNVAATGLKLLATSAEVTGDKAQVTDNNSTWGKMVWVAGPATNVTDWTLPETTKAGVKVAGATAIVRDSSGNPVKQGTVVKIQVPGAEPQEVTVEGTDGKVKIPAFTPTAGGDVKVTITAGDGTPLTDGEKTVTVTAGDLDVDKSEFKVSEGTKKVTDTHLLTVTLRDANNNLIKDASDEVLKSLTVAGTKADSQDTVTFGDWDKVGDGTYTRTITATTPGEYTVTVTAPEDKSIGNKDNNDVASFEAGDPYINPDPSQAANSTHYWVDADSVEVGQVRKVYVELKDAKGNKIAPTEDLLKNLTAQMPSGSGITQGTWSTGDNDLAVLEMTGTKPGAYNITVVRYSNNRIYNVPESGNITATWINGPADTTDASKTFYTITPGESGVVADGTAEQTINITLKDKYGNPAKNTAEDITITPADGGPAATDLQGANGTFTAKLKTTTAGTYTYTITVNGVENPVQVQSGTTGKDKAVFTPGVITQADLEVSNPGTSDVPLEAGTPVDVTYTPKDANGNTVKPSDPNAKVTATLPGGKTVDLGWNDEAQAYVAKNVPLETATPDNGKTAGKITVSSPVEASAVVYVAAGKPVAGESVAVIKPDYAPYANQGEEATSADVLTVTLKDGYGNAAPLAEGQTIKVTQTGEGQENFTLTIGAVAPVANKVGVYTVNLTATSDKDLAVEERAPEINFTLKAELNDDEGTTAIAEGLTAHFASPPVNTNIADTYFEVKADSDPVYADGADTYTVTVKLSAQEAGKWELQPVSDRESTLAITDLSNDGAITVVEDFQETETPGVYVAKIASKDAHTANIQVTTSDALIHVKGGNATEADAVFAPNDFDATSPLTVNNKATHTATVGDTVTLKVTPKNSHGHVVGVPEGVSVTGLTNDPIKLKQQSDGSYTAEVPVATINADPGYTLTPVKTGTNDRVGADATLKVEPGRFSAKDSTLEFKPAEGATKDNFVAGKTTNVVFTPKDENGYPTHSMVDEKSELTATITDGKDNTYPITLKWDAASGTYTADAPVGPIKGAGDAKVAVDGDSDVPNDTMTVKADKPFTITWNDDTWKQAADTETGAQNPVPGVAGETVTGTTGKVVDQYGNEVPANTPVSYQTPDGNTVNTTTGENGVLTVADFTLPTAAGPYTVPFTSNGITLSTVNLKASSGDVSTDPANTYHSTATIDSGDKVADGTESYKVTVTLVDKEGNKVSGKDGDLSLVPASGTEALTESLKSVNFKETGEGTGVYEAKVSSTAVVSGTIQAKYADKNVDNPLAVNFIAGKVETNPENGKNAGGEKDANAVSWSEITPGTRKADNKDAHVLTVHLRDAYGHPVANADLSKLGLNATVKQNSGSTLSTHATVGTTNLQAGEWANAGNGAYTVNLTSPDIATYEVTASYSGSDIHVGTAGETGVTVDPADVTHDAEYVLGDITNAGIKATSPIEYNTVPKDVRITATDEAGHPAANQEVWVKIGTGEPQKVTLDAYGTAALDGSGSNPSIGALKDNTTIAVYAKEPVDDTVKPLAETTIVVKLPAPTGVEANKADASSPVIVSGKLEGAPEGAKIRIKDEDGKILAEDVTVTNGSFSYPVTGPEVDTKVSVEAYMPEDASRNSAPAEATVTQKHSPLRYVEAVQAADKKSAELHIGLPADVQVGDEIKVVSKDDPNKVIAQITVRQEDLQAPERNITRNVPTTALPLPENLSAVISSDLTDPSITSSPIEGPVYTKEQAPTDLRLVRDPVTGDVHITGTVPGVTKETPVTVTAPNGTTFPVTTDASGKIDTTVAGGTALPKDAQVTATAGTGKETSNPSAAVPVEQKLAAPTKVEGVKAADGKSATVTVTVPTGTPAGTVISIKDGKGNEIATATVDTEVTDDAGKPVEVKFTEEPGDGEGDIADLTDVISADLTPLKGENKDTALTSAATNGTVATKTATPTDLTVTVTPDGKVVVSGEVPDASGDTTVDVTLPNGEVIEDVPVKDGKFDNSDKPFEPKTPVEPGKEATAVATEEGKPASDPSEPATVNLQLPAPTKAEASRSADGSTVTVNVTVDPKTPVGSKVQVVDPTDPTKVLGKAVYNGGTDPVTITLTGDEAKALEGKTTVPVQVAPADNATNQVPSATTDATIGDVTPTPSITSATRDAAGTVTVTVTGKVPGAAQGTLVTVKDAQNNPIGTGVTTDKDGNFTVTVTGDKAPAVDSTVTAVAQDNNHKLLPSEPSKPATVTAQPVKVEDVKATKDPVSGKTTIEASTDAPEDTPVKVELPGGKTVDGVVKGDNIVDKDGNPIVVDGLKKDDEVKVTVGTEPYAATGTTKVTESKVTPYKAPSTVTAVKDPETGKTTITATVDSTVPNYTKVTVTLPNGDTVEGKVKDGGIVDKDGNPIVVDGLKKGDEVKVSVGEGPLKSDDAHGKVTESAVTPYAKPEATAVKGDDGKTTIDGSSDAPNGTKVTVKDKDGKVIGEGKVQDGKIVGTDDKPLVVSGPSVGDKVQVTVGEGAKESKTAEATVSDKADQSKTATPSITNAVVDDKGHVTVTGSVPDAGEGTTVTVTLPDGTKLTGKTDDKGIFTVEGDPTTAPKAGEKVSVTAQAPGKSESAPAEKELTSEPVDPVEQSAQPKVDSVVVKDNGDVTISGSVPGAGEGTTITVTLPDGTKVTGTTGKDGSFNFTVTPKTPVKDGDKVKVTATEPGKTESEPTDATVTKAQPAVTKEDAPTNVNAERDPKSGDTTITGGSTAPDGTKVTVKDEGGKTIGEGKVEGGKIVDNDGNPLVVPGLKDGDKVSVTVGEGDKESKPATATVSDKADGKEDAPTNVDAERDPKSGDTTITGDSTAPDGTKVTVKDGNGNVIGEGKVEGGKIVDKDGNPLVVPGLKNGDKIQVTVGEGDKQSEPATATVSDKDNGNGNNGNNGGWVPGGNGGNTGANGGNTGSAVADPTNVVVTPNGNGATVSGTTTPGATVTVTLPDGSTVTTTADANGNFSIEVPGVKAGDELKIQSSKDGQTSGVVTVKVPGQGGIKGALASTGASGQIIAMTAAMLLAGGLVLLVAVRRRKSEES